MGFVKYSLQYVIIILTFVGVSLCFRSILGLWITSATLEYIDGEFENKVLFEFQIFWLFATFLV